MVVIKCNALLNPVQKHDLESNIHEQAATGVIVLPACCDLLHAHLGNEGIVIKYADGRAVPLTAESDCKTCKQTPGCHHNAGARGVVRVNCPLWRPKGKG